MQDLNVNIKPENAIKAKNSYFFKTIVVFIQLNEPDLAIIRTPLIDATKEANRVKQMKVLVKFGQPLCHKALSTLIAASKTSEL